MITNQGILYIEPSGMTSAEPVIDELTRKMAAALSNSKPSKEVWRGYHVCDCGSFSTNRDYILPNGQKTNSLCVHYLAYHREEVPKAQLEKVVMLGPDQMEPTEQQLAPPGTTPWSKSSNR
jgi:hypothetical protein